MVTISYGWLIAFGFACGFGWLLTVVFGALAMLNRWEADGLIEFVKHFVNQDRVNEVLVRRAMDLAYCCSQAIAEQQERISNPDSAVVEDALAEAQEEVQAAKRSFFGPLDSLEALDPFLTISRGESHKDYLVPDAKDCVDAVDVAYAKLFKQLLARSQVRDGVKGGNAGAGFGG